MAVLAHLVQEHHLVGEDVRRVAVVVVEVAQLRVQEARRAGRRDHPGRADLGDVLAAAVHLALALLGAERFLGALGHVVDHRVPDRARVLQHVHVDVAELRGQHVQVERPRVVHVEHGGGAVGDHQAGVADRAVGRCAQRDDHHVEIALGAADRCLTESVVSKNRWKPSFSSSRCRSGTGKSGSSTTASLLTCSAQQLRIEVVLVQMRDVEVVAVAEGGPVQAAVVGEDEPRTEVRRVDPWVAQDASRLGVDPKAGVADACDLHNSLSSGVGTRSSLAAELSARIAALGLPARIVSGLG